MKRLYILLMLIVLFCVTATAQFGSSSDVYIYEYSYTDNDGIKTSTTEDPTIYFVNIQNNVLGFYSGSKSLVKKKMMDDPDYYDNLATQNVSSGYSNLKRNGRPSTIYDFKSLYLFDGRYSTSNKYTYRYYSTGAVFRNGGTGWMGCPMPPVLVWNSWTYGNNCYSFTADRSEMFSWSIDSPEYRTYYKRISKNDLKTNLDFLY